MATAWNGTIAKGTEGDTLSITATQGENTVTHDYAVPGASVETESVFYVLVDAVVNAMTFIIK